MILTKIELVAFSILVAYGAVGLYWMALFLVKYIRFGRKERRKKLEN